VTPEHPPAIYSQCWTGSEGGEGDITVRFVKGETYCISFEEFKVQFDDPGAHVY